VYRRVEASVSASPIAALNVSGTYTFVNIVPGRYRVEAEKTGFKKFAREPERLSSVLSRRDSFRASASGLFFSSSVAV
jgi:hypothetical protein